MSTPALGVADHKPDLAAKFLLDIPEMTPASVPELKTSVVHRPLVYFATITVHGLANETNRGPAMLRLNRVPTSLAPSPAQRLVSILNGPAA
jgi:hypothetical protein